jgi:hypothetical protein
MLEKPATRYLILLSVLSSAVCISYFYMLDRLLFSSAAFSYIFRRFVQIEDTQTAWLSMLVCAIAAFWSNPGPVLKISDLLGRRPLLIATLAIAILSAGTLIVYQNYALCMDEYAAIFQSKIFAAGQIIARLPVNMIDWLIAPGFNGQFLLASHRTGWAVEAYWPGFALLLAPFQFLHVQWLCNPFLAGLSLYLIHRITINMTGDRMAAGMAVLLTICSGAFLANAISFYSMQAHLTANLMFVWLLLNPTFYRSLSAGFVGSIALVLHNPMPHVLFATPWILAFAVDPSRRRHLLPLIVGYLPVSVLIGVGWLMLKSLITGGPHGAAAMNAVVSSVFGWPNAAILNMRAAAIAKMWIWAVPSLFVLAAVGRIRHSDNQHVRLLAQSALLTFLAYLFVNLDQGHGWGYRYFHTAWGVIPILAACALTGEEPLTKRLTAFAGAAAILNIALVVPLQMFQIRDFIADHRAHIDTPRRPGNNVYFISPGAGSYLVDMIQTDPLLRDPDLLLMSHGPLRDAEFVHRHWPEAIRLGGVWAEQWYLGPGEQRRAVTGTSGEMRFVFASDPVSQSR